MPNLVDEDRLGQTMVDAVVVHMDEYKRQAEMRRAATQAVSAPQISFIGVNLTVMLVLIAICFFLFWRRA